MKCPLKLAKIKAEPDELHKLTPKQRASHFCEMDGNFAALKRGHKYYTQIQVIICQNDLSRGVFMLSNFGLVDGSMNHSDKLLPVDANGCDWI